MCIGSIPLTEENIGVGNNSGVLGRSLGQRIERSGLFATLFSLLQIEKNSKRCLLANSCHRAENKMAKSRTFYLKKSFFFAYTS